MNKTTKILLGTVFIFILLYILPITSIETEHVSTNIVLNYRESYQHTMISGHVFEIGYYPFTVSPDLFTGSSTVRALIINGEPHSLSYGIHRGNGNYLYDINVISYKEDTIVVNVAEHKLVWMSPIQKILVRREQ